jgi:TonB-linked SusC/RagA family outer membrane protein
MLVGGVGPALGQAPRVTGTVVTGSDTGTPSPVSGVTVMVKGKAIGTTTGTEGSYAIAATSPTDTLVFSMLGFVTQEIPIAGRTAINVTLQASVVALQGVVVVGYGTQTKASLSGSVSAVGAEDISRTSASTTTEALVGKLPGLTSRITNSELGDARPGASTILQIRNMGAPLIVIDGVPYDYTPTGSDYDRTGESSLNPLDNINPSDIESISILKDASASVYGFRAANGVVLVTTKRGRNNQRPRVSVDGYYGIQNLTRYPFGPRPANSYEFERAWVESEQNRGQARTVSPEELENWRIGAPGYESYNQYDVVINHPNAPQYSFNGNVSGGGENSQYYFSFGRVSQDYVMKDNTFNRTNIQANLRAELADGLAVGMQLSGGLENRDNVAIPGREDVIYNAMLGINSSWPMDQPWANDNPAYVNGDVQNLVRLGSTFTRDVAGFQEDVRRNANGNFFAEYTFPFGMQAKATYSNTFRLNSFERQRYSYDAYCYDAETDTYDVCSGFYGAQRDKQRREVQQQFAQLQLTHKVQLGDHKLSGTLAAEASGSEIDFTGIGAVPPSNFTRLIEFVQQNSLDNSWSKTARRSLVGRFNYDYQQKYLIEADGRYDGSYLYAPGKRWGFFPGVSVAWRPMQESFLKDRVSFLDELKLRASWGQAGREQGVSPWDYLGGATFGAGGGYLFDGEVITGVRPRGLPVTNLTWVTSTSTNAGVDFGLFGRLTGTFDVFQRKLSGLPAPRYDVLLPVEVGYGLPDENLESEATQGAEGVLTFTDLIGDVSYSLSASATVAREKILSRYKPRYGNSWDQYVNGEVGRWDDIDMGYEVIGRFQSVEEIENYPIDNDLQGNITQLPGDLIFKDVNGDRIINAMDRRPIGYGVNQNPILMYGINGSVEYRGVSLNLDLSGGSMYSYRQDVESRIPFQGNHNSQIWMLTDRWHRADPYNDQSEWIPGRYPAIRRGLSNHNNLAGNRGGDSNFYATNVTYLRVKRVELGYELPEALLSKFSMGRTRIYGSLANPISFDNLKKFNTDPEVAQAAALRYPTPRVLSVGFRTSLGGGR